MVRISVECALCGKSISKIVDDTDKDDTDKELWELFKGDAYQFVVEDGEITLLYGFICKECFEKLQK